MVKKTLYFLNEPRYGNVVPVLKKKKKKTDPFDPL